MINKRPLKGHLPPQEVFALGSKTKSGADSEVKPSSSTSGVQQMRKPGQSSSTLGFKRDAGSLTAVAGPPSKKPRPPMYTFAPLGRPGDTEYRGSPTTQVYLYEEIANEVEAHEFLEAVEEAVGKADDEHLEALLCGAVKRLKMSRAKPDLAMCFSLMYLVKIRPSLFQSEVVVEAFSSLLKRDVAVNFKAKGNALVSVLASNILATAFQDEDNWPDSFVKVFLDDSLGERLWVDRPDCRLFVENIMTAFNTKLPVISVMANDASMKNEVTGGGSSPLQGVPFGEDDDSTVSSDKVKTIASTSINEYEIPSSLIYARYTTQYMSIETYVLDVIRDQLSRRQPMDGGSRNLVRTMITVCGYSDIRMLAAHRLEMWLQNPKSTRAAQDLLMSICMNCDQQHSQQDFEVTNLLSKIRLKTKSLVNHFMLCIKELLGQNTENLSSLLSQTTYNELQFQSATRNPNNMSLFSVMFHEAPEQSTKLLAEIFVDILTNRDDHLKMLRALLRELCRTVRLDLNLNGFALGLMCERSDAKFRDLDPFLKERYFIGVIDLLCETMLLGVSSSVREAASAAARFESRDSEMLRSFQNQIAFIQRDAVWWLHAVVPKMIGVKPSEYLHGLRKLLFTEKPEHYYKMDNWPPENERSIMLKLVSEVPILEDTLIRILLMGLNRDFHLSAPDVIDLTDILVRRAALLHAEDFPVLKVDRLEFIDALLNLCTYRHPENIILPKGYQPPALAITTLYWKSWTILLILSAFNPNSFGLKAWENYPSLKCMMEMTMTNNFKFPPPTVASDEKTAEEIRNRERQMVEFVKHQILEFEGHLAAATSKQPITETNSLLITQLTRLEPEGLALHPPPAVIDHIKSLNQSLHIGHMLCRSRNPDFLLDIIQRQGTSQSMPWLAELVESNDSSLDVLPVQCLCEFLLHGSSSDSTVTSEDVNDKQKKFHKQQKQEQLLSRLHNMLYSAVSDPQVISEVLGYFLKRLHSPQTAARKQATKGLAMVLSKSSPEEHASSSVKRELLKKESMLSFNRSALDPILVSHLWLLEKLPSLPQFDVIKIPLCLALRQACQVETDAFSVSSYIIFLSQHTDDFQLQDLHCLALDLAQLIVERATLISNLLPQEENSNNCAQVVLAAMIHIFYNYLIKAQQTQRESYSWSNTQDQILLQWGSGKCATMNILVVHAMIILLTYGMPTGESNFVDLLESWFPENGSPPSAFLVDTSEEALLLPDWLKLRMIRSSVHRLVDAALTDLEPSQLLLFVQSFGIPVVSMSKLLHCLDEAVETDSCEIEQAIVDKGYMAQLIEVQRMRGATGGDKFHRLLIEGSSSLIPEDESPSWLTIHPDKIQHNAKTFQLSSLLPCDVHCLSIALPKVVGMTEPFADSHEQHNLYRSLLKSIQKSSTPDVFLNVWSDIICSGEGKTFTKGLQQHSFVTAALLKLLTQKVSCLDFTMLLLSELQPTDSVLLSTLKYFVYVLNTKSGASFHQPPGNKSLIHDFKDGSLLEMLHYLGLADGELKANNSFNEILSTEKLLGTVTDLTCQAICAEGSRDQLISSVRGFLVDWIEVLNSDIVNHVGTQLQYVFLKHHAFEEGVSTFQEHVTCDCRQTYMLGLLINHSSWINLRLMLNHLLSSDVSKKKFCASAILDFLWACIHLPRLWQGRDKKLSKNHVDEDILGLSVDQITVLVDYIIEEETRVAATTMKDKVVECSVHHISDIAEKRMELLCRCCCGNYHLLNAVVLHLTKQIESGKETWGPCHRLMMDLYLWIPQLLKNMKSCTSIFRSTKAPDKQISQLDIISHHLINSLASAGSGKSCESRMLNSSVACRKIASDHPIILLRQLPMLSALLQGRAQYTFGEIKSRNLLLLYTHVLGILEVLQPIVFEPVHKVALQNLLQAYLDLIMIHGLCNKSLGGLIQKFLHFLQNYVNFNRLEAVGFLKNFLPVFNELNTCFAEMPVLGSLLASLALPAQRNMEPFTGETASSLSPSDASQLTVRSGFTCNPSSITHLLQRTKKNTNVCDLVDALKELDETSKRCVEILEYFMTDVRRLMLNANEVCRNSAFGFMMRMIRHNPKAAQEFKRTMLESLVSENPDVVRTALKHIGDYVMLAQEYGQELLDTAFQVGIKTNLDTHLHIAETIQLLNMDILS